MREFGLWLQPKPVDDNPYHANMVYTEIDKRHGEELDDLETAQFQEKLRLLVERGEYFTEAEAVKMAEVEGLPQQ